MSINNLDSSTLDVIYEDEWLIVINKPVGLSSETQNAGSPSLEKLVSERLGTAVTLFHRLDKDTTGLIVLGKKRSINKAMSDAFEHKRLRKSYLAVVHGRWEKSWNRVETQIDRGPDGKMRNQTEGGKKSLTTFRVFSSTDEKSWIEAIPKTGRTHQIRLHCLAQGCPILGDRIYGLEKDRDPSLPPQALHAYRLDFMHPATTKPMTLRAPPPDYWQAIWLQGLKTETLLKRLFEST